VRVLDLGTGTGSNLRYLLEHLPRLQQWTVVDARAPAGANRCLGELTWL
jgi:spermidine synthase